MTDMLSFILITTVQMPCVFITSFSCYSLSQQPVILLWPSLSLVISGYSLYFNTSNTSCPCSPHTPTLFMLSCGWTRLCSWTGYPMDLTVQPCLFTAVVTEENPGLDIKHWLVPLLKFLEIVTLPPSSIFWRNENSTTYPSEVSGFIEILFWFTRNTSKGDSPLFLFPERFPGL